MNIKIKKFRKIICTILIIALGVSLFFVSVALYKEKNKKLSLDDIESLQKEQINNVLTEISKHMVLPKDEQPTVATIANVDELKKQMPFFDKAQNGFKVIVYKEKAILFDPANNIIVDVAPVVQQKEDELQQNINISNENDSSNENADVKPKETQKENEENSEDSNIKKEMVAVELSDNMPINVRDKGSMEGKKITKIKNGGKFEKIEESGDWVHIIIPATNDSDQIKGWIHKKFIVE